MVHEHHDVQWFNVLFNKHCLFFLDVEKSFNPRDTKMKGRETASFLKSIFQIIQENLDHSEIEFSVMKKYTN